MALPELSPSFLPPSSSSSPRFSSPPLPYLSLFILSLLPIGHPYYWNIETQQPSWFPPEGYSSRSSLAAQLLAYPSIFSFSISLSPPAPLLFHFLFFVSPFLFLLSAVFVGNFLPPFLSIFDVPCFA